jgi:acyl-CoA dehydrogenase
MPFLLTDEQRQIGSQARRFLNDASADRRPRELLEELGEFDHAFWTGCQEMGWTGVTVPEVYGGLALSPVELCLVALECGRALAGAPFLATSFALGEALRLWGDEASKTRFLPGVAAGELKGALAFGEARGAALSHRPSVTFVDGRITGLKRWVVGGAAADLALVLAVDGAGAPCLALTDLRVAAVTRAPVQSLDNSRCTADLTFLDAPAQALAAPDASTAAADLLQRAALVTAFEQLGGAEACMEMARDYANQRHAFGQPIGKFQAIKHKIAEMYVLNEVARGAAMRAVLALAEDQPDLAIWVAAARLAASEAYEYAAGEAIQVHGAIGVTWEHDLHLHYRRARANALEFGAKAAWEDLIVDRLAEKA